MIASANKQPKGSNYPKGTGNDRMRQSSRTILMTAVRKWLHNRHRDRGCSGWEGDDVRRRRRRWRGRSREQEAAAPSLLIHSLILLCDKSGFPWDTFLTDDFISRQIHYL
jgi:hypothetical protein